MPEMQHLSLSLRVDNFPHSLANFMYFVVIHSTFLLFLILLLISGGKITEEKKMRAATLPFQIKV